MTGSTLIDSAAADQQPQARQMSAEVGKKQSDARRLRESKPQDAVKLLQQTREQVAKSQLSEDYRTQLTAADRHHARRNRKVHQGPSTPKSTSTKITRPSCDEVNRNREVRLKVQEKIAELVDEFNRLRDEQRYAEMEIVARRLNEIAPDEDGGASKSG